MIRNIRFILVPGLSVSVPLLATFTTFYVVANTALGYSNLM
jgi:hypothetical protein